MTFSGQGPVVGSQEGWELSVQRQRQYRQRSCGIRERVLGTDRSYSCDNISPPTLAWPLRCAKVQKCRWIVGPLRHGGSGQFERALPVCRPLSAQRFIDNLYAYSAVTAPFVSLFFCEPQCALRFILRSHVHFSSSSDAADVYGLRCRRNFLGCSDAAYISHAADVYELR